MAQKKNDKPNSQNQTNYLEEKEYEYAISLMQYHIELLWHTFGIFMLAETIIIGFLGNAILDENNKLVIGENIIVFTGAIIGLVICILWLLTYSHNYKYYVLRMAQARRHEKILGFRLLTEGKKVGDGGVVKIGEEEFSHPSLVKSLRPSKAIPALIIIFGLIFISLIFIAHPF